MMIQPGLFLSLSSAAFAGTLVAPIVPQNSGAPALTDEHGDARAPFGDALDLNADGRADVVWLEAGGRLRVLLGREGGRFEVVEAPIALTTAPDRTGADAGPLTGTWSLEWRDLDADGDPDLLAVGLAGPRLFENLGELQFLELPDAGGLAGAGPGRPRWVEPDGGAPSALIWSGPDAVRVFLAEGDLRFRLDGEFPAAAQRLPELSERPDSSASRASAGSGVATPGGAALPLTPSGICASSIVDVALGTCIRASSLAALGQLYPLSLDFNVDVSGNVGMGTAAPADKLHVAGVVRAESGLRFGDGSLQTSAGTRDWDELDDVPAGFADGVDHDTLYTAGSGVTLAAGAFGLDTSFGDARYWNETQALGGDLAGSGANAVVDGLQGRAVSGTAPSNGQVIKWNGSSWAPAADIDTNTTYSAGTGLALAGTTLSVAGSGIGPNQLAVDGGSLERVSGGLLRNSAGGLLLNTNDPSARMHVVHGSSTADPHLRLTQSGASAFARLAFSSLASAQSWTIAGGLGATPDGDRLNFFHSSTGDVLSISGEGRVGIETTSPLTALHVAGSLHLQGTAQDISVQTGEQLQFGHYDGTTFAERMRIDSTGKVTTTGDLTVGGTLELGTTTRWYSISGAGFRSDLLVDEQQGGQIAIPLGSPASVSYSASAPLLLPHGARIVSMLVRLLDTSTSRDSTTRIQRRPYASMADSPETLVTVSSSGSSAWQLPSSSAVTSPIIDNENYSYYVNYDGLTPSASDTGYLTLYAVRVEYEVTSPLP